MQRLAESTLLRLKRCIAPGCALLCFAVAAYALAAVWAGTTATWNALTTLGATAFAAGTGVCAVTFLVRFLRWRAILAHWGHHLPTWFNVRVYVAGMALSSTPGKLGETLRSALLVPRGIEVRHSLAAFVADRLSDVIGVAALGVVAGVLAQRRQAPLEVIVAVAAVGAALAAHWLRRPRARPIAGVSQPSRLDRWTAVSRGFAIAWAEVWSGPRALAYSVIAMCAYGLQALVFAGYVIRVAPNAEVAVCVTIFASATLIGAASLVPGGLGAMDSALVLQLQSHGVALPEAIAATLATRASTLWLAWLLGIGALMSFAGLPVHRPSPSERAARP